MSAGKKMWTASEARNRFGALLDAAERDGPQIVRRRGLEFVVMTEEAYESLRKTAVGLGDNGRAKSAERESDMDQRIAEAMTDRATGKTRTL